MQDALPAFVLSSGAPPTAMNDSPANPQPNTEAPSPSDEHDDAPAVLARSQRGLLPLHQEPVFAVLHEFYYLADRAVCSHPLEG